jgi:hypothetical protein
MESWKSIDEYPAYEVSTLGRVRRGEKVLRSGFNQSGYGQTQLWNNGFGRSLCIHRLVAIAFIPNPDGKKEVDHINRIKTDNRVENLRWSTRSENQINVPTRAEHRHIRIRCDHYQVHIRRMSKTIFCKTYATLDEAIAGRDAFLTTTSSYPSSSRRRHTGSVRPDQDGSPMPCA